MKNLLLPLVLAIFLCSGKITAQGCLPDGITFETQGQIDSFPMMYPGCTTILGDVCIVESVSGNITNLDSLAQIQLIEGSLDVHFNVALQRLHGLDQLDSVKSCLRIWQNPALINMTGLGSLSYVGKCTFINGVDVVNQFGLYITANDSLLSLDGLNNLQSVGACVRIQQNPLLTSITALENLASIGNCFNRSGSSNSNTSLAINENVSLPALNGLGQLDSVDYIWIGGNASLKSLEGLDKLVYVQGCLSISNNDSLGTLSGLEQLTYVGDGTCSYSSGLGFISSTESFTIASNGALKSLVGLDKLSYAWGLTIEHNDSLQAIPGFASPFAIENLTVTDNDALTELSGLEELETINGDVAISTNPALTSLNGLGNLKSIGGDLSIFSNQALPNLNGLNQLESVGGNLNIGRTLFRQGSVWHWGPTNDALTSLSGLDALTTIGGDLTLSGNPALGSLSSLGNLTAIGGNLSLLSNKALPNLTGMDSLKSIDGQLRVGQDITPGSQPTKGDVNEALTSLSGLDNIDPTTITKLFIEAAPNLSFCEVKSICAYLENPANPASISGNAGGCNTRAEVEAACDVVSDISTPIGQSIRLYPNPGSGRFTLEGLDNGQVTVLDQLGRVRLEQAFTGSEIDLSGLPAGVYFLRIRSGDRWGVGRVLKQ